MKFATTLKMIRKDNFEIWHKRLGHPSDKLVSLLPFVDAISDTCASCEVCLQAKQCSGEFMSNNNKAYRVLEMMHCDLWGPHRTPTFCVHIIF